MVRDLLGVVVVWVGGVPELGANEYPDLGTKKDGAMWVCPKRCNCDFGLGW